MRRLAGRGRWRHTCRRCGSACWLVYHGPGANHTLEPDLSRAEAAERERDELREALHLLVDAVAPLMPVRGGWPHYKVEKRIDPTLRAAPDEWATAAHHFCEAAEVLAALPEGATQEEQT